MAVGHGRERYRRGCRCDECKEAQRVYQRVYRERHALGLTQPPPTAENSAVDPGPVELAVQSELATLVSAESRPALAAVALAMARLLDSPAAGPKPAAAKVLISAMETLHKASAQGRRGSLALVKTMTKKDGA
jgi:hypothetical protein